MPGNPSGRYAAFANLPIGELTPQKNRTLRARYPLKFGFHAAVEKTILAESQ